MFEKKKPIKDIRDSMKYKNINVDLKQFLKKFVDKDEIKELIVKYMSYAQLKNSKNKFSPKEYKVVNCFDVRTKDECYDIYIKDNHFAEIKDVDDKIVFYHKTGYEDAIKIVEDYFDVKVDHWREEK